MSAEDSGKPDPRAGKATAASTVQSTAAIPCTTCRFGPLLAFASEALRSIHTLIHRLC